MSTAIELNSVFDQVEELVGTYPSADGLRNAIHAVITKGVITKYIDVDSNLGGIYRRIGSDTIINNVEYLARNYETLRGTHMHMGVNGQGISCSYAMDWGYTFGVKCDTPTK